MPEEVFTCPRCGATIGVTVSANMSYTSNRTLFHDCPGDDAAVPADLDAPIPGGSDAIKLSRPHQDSN